MMDQLNKYLKKFSRDSYLNSILISSPNEDVFSKGTDFKHLKELLAGLESEKVLDYF